MALVDLFPPIEPYLTGFLPVSALHTLYWEQSGAPDGVPVLFLHGGPGAGASVAVRRFFDPKAWRIVVFDQRGSGRSKPLYETKDNSTAFLIDDIEALRNHLGIERWHVFGGSWGSTLALAYAEAFPERCLGLMLRGVFLMRQREIDWFFEGIRRFFPDKWEAFAGFLPEQERGNLLDAYLAILQGPDEARKAEALRTWIRFESSCGTLYPVEDGPHFDYVRRSAMPLIEAFYFKHNKFSPEDKLLREVGKIRTLPAFIVQGRYDMICPLESAYALHKAWPEAAFRIVPDAGHALFEPGIRSALIEATEAFKEITG